MNKRGFTLIELMIVVAIIGILACIAIPEVSELHKKSKRRAKTGNVAVVKQFSANGDKMGEWRVKSFIDRDSGYVRFTTTDEKLITVSGAFVVEE